MENPGKITIECKRCGTPHLREDLQFSYDCHGITYRLVCPKCMEQIEKIGYDGEEYSELDECITEDY